MIIISGEIIKNLSAFRNEKSHKLLTVDASLKCFTQNEIYPMKDTRTEDRALNRTSKSNQTPSHQLQSF